MGKAHMAAHAALSQGPFCPTIGKDAVTCKFFATGRGHFRARLPLIRADIGHFDPWRAYVRRPANCHRTVMSRQGIQMKDRRNSYSYEELLACGRGELFGAANAQLPLPPMLMFDRITVITEDGGEHGRGLIPAELDLKPDLWFFGCHFKGDPVMPGCLGLDALWQMLGFFLGWTGGQGRGRALGLGDLKFSGQVMPNVRKIVYNVDIKRVMRLKLWLGIADGWLSTDGEIIYRAKDLRVGLFKQGTAPA